MATKALCGYQVVNIGKFANANQITETCERAGGRVFYWVKREDLECYRRSHE